MSGAHRVACRGMRLADTVFLTMPVALLQVWLGMRCSRPGMHCRIFLGHQSFNILLLISIVASIIGALRLCLAALPIQQLGVVCQSCLRKAVSTRSPVRVPLVLC